MLSAFQDNLLDALKKQSEVIQRMAESIDTQTETMGKMQGSIAILEKHSTAGESCVLH